MTANGNARKPTIDAADAVGRSDAKSLVPRPAESMATLRKCMPTCQMPSGAALRGLSAAQVQRLRRSLSEPLEFVYETHFARASAERLVSEATPLVDRLRAAGSEIPHHEGAKPPRIKALTLAEERTLFLALNYARYRMARVLRAFAGRRLTVAALGELTRWSTAASDVCDAIIQANLGLVPTMVERSRVTGVEFAELIAEGHLALLRAVSKFDCSRGFKFSTYACRAILTAIIRSVSLMARHKAHFPTEFDPALQTADGGDLRRTAERDDELSVLRAAVRDNRADLTLAEKRVLAERFGVAIGREADRSDAEPKTLREVAAVFGVTKERVRQIQNRALEKLRGALNG